MGTSDLELALPTWLTDDSFLGSPFLSVEGGQLDFSADGAHPAQLEERLTIVNRLIDEIEESCFNPAGTLIYEAITFERQQLFGLLD